MDMNEMMELSQEFAELGKELHGSGDNETALERIVQLAVKHIDGCSGASITVVRGNRGRSLATSDPIAARADALQYEMAEGPCLRGAEQNANYLLFDVAKESRWPRFCATLVENTPIRSALSFPLVAEDSATLNLFAEQPGAFSDDDIDLATVFAAHASSLVALHEAEDQAANLEAALESSREIGAAIGVLMAHRKVTQDEAFALLRATSQTLHRKLRDVASEVVETGTLPDLPMGIRRPDASAS
jgi:GAF domain-containing protein